ncbi:MAG TPA: FoF1 ATP synthase subunit a [Candidatus Aquilonibacter sp.]|nr:FoF1 ATP synthase subunit a [Candidatus Aquilonibacter sp.]
MNTKEALLPPTRFINWILGKPALALLALLHIKPDNPQFPIPNYLAMEVILFLILGIFFVWLKARISADRPGATQQTMEMLLTNPMGVGVKDLIDDIVGHGGDRHVAMMGTIGIFILGSNLMSLVPVFMSPTAVDVVPLGCATVVFIYYNMFGIGHHGGVGYAKTLLGPLPAISPVMFIVETISHFARILSLTVRLWANMMVSELIYLTFLALTMGLFTFLGSKTLFGYISGIIPVGIPLALSFFHIFEALLQAFIFVILSIIYLGVAVSEEH